MTDIARALDQFVAAHFDGDATKALLALAGHANIAVAWMDRQVFANEFELYGVTLTDELWTQIALKLGDFDGYVGDTDVHADYAKYYLRTLVSTNDRGEPIRL